MFDIEENLKKLPDSPGVYIHKDKLGQVIYVGKAISLKKRVRQYFQASANTNPKVRAMVSHIAEFEYINCSTEMEALILECNLIKKYMPKYNVLLRDDKTYPYIMVTTTEDYPRIIKTRIVKKDGNKYFGPYSDAGAVNKIVELLSGIYSLKKCTAGTFPEGHRPCLNYHIGQCAGVCTGNVSIEEYRKNVNEIISFLSGKDKPLIRKLENKMKTASEEMKFEEAAKYRDLLISIKLLSETQRVTIGGNQDIDIILPVQQGGNSFMVLFPVREGKLSGRETFRLQAETYDDRNEIISGFIKQYYGQFAVAPKEIIVDEVLNDAHLIEEYLSKQGHKVKILVPKKGDKKALLDLSKNDVIEMVKTLEQKSHLMEEKKIKVRSEVESVISQAGYKAEQKEQYRVESYDISNTNGVDSVGAMVVFEGLSKVKKDYRRFKIKTVEGPDDYGSLQEMLYRRFKRAQEGNSSFIKLPDIIFMDGGLGQVSAARKVLNAMKVDIPVVGMAKDEGHRTRAIIFEDGHELVIYDRPVLLRYAATVQEEVHRFAIEYHRNLRNKNSIQSVLDNIEGIGPARRNALLKHFKTIAAIKEANVSELMEVRGITQSVANNIKEYFC